VIFVSDIYIFSRSKKVMLVNSQRNKKDVYYTKILPHKVVV